MEKLEEMLKKFVYTGVGFISLSAEKMKKTVEELVANKKMTEEEGKKLLDEFFKEADLKKGVIEKKLKKTIKKVSEKMKYVSADEVDKLNKRIRDLEQVVADMQGKKE